MVDRVFHPANEFSYFLPVNIHCDKIMIDVWIEKFNLNFDKKFCSYVLHKLTDEGHNNVRQLQNVQLLDPNPKQNNQRRDHQIHQRVHVPLCLRCVNKKMIEIQKIKYDETSNYTKNTRQKCIQSNCRIVNIR